MHFVSRRATGEVRTDSPNNCASFYIFIAVNFAELMIIQPCMEPESPLPCVEECTIVPSSEAQKSRAKHHIPFLQGFFCQYCLLKNSIDHPCGLIFSYFPSKIP